MSSGPVLSTGLDELKLSILCNTVNIKAVRYIWETDSSCRPLNRPNTEIPNRTSKKKITLTLLPAAQNKPHTLLPINCKKTQLLTASSLSSDNLKMSKQNNAAGTLTAPILQTDGQPKRGSNCLVCATPVRAGSKIHSNLPAELLMFMLGNTSQPNPSLVSFLDRHKNAKRLHRCTTGLIWMQGKKSKWLWPLVLRFVLATIKNINTVEYCEDEPRGHFKHTSRRLSTLGFGQVSLK